jgi:thiaminase
MNYEDIIQALKEGNVPLKGTSEICVGRDLEFEEIRRLFDKIEEGKGLTKFIEGDYGAGKSFMLKIIEEMAFEDNLVVSKVTITRDVPFNKFEEVYKDIVGTLRCKTGISLQHVIERWLRNLRMFAMEETSDQIEQNRVIMENMRKDLKEARKYSNSFATAIERYYGAATTGDEEIANYAQAWLRGDSNIPFPIKRQFGVKGDVTKENAFFFLEALAAFLSSIGYNGLVVLIDELELIRTLHNQKMRDTAYHYLRFIYDECNQGRFEKTLFVFAGTSELYDDPRKGIPSYKALDDRIKDELETSYNDLRKPIMRLDGFKKDNLEELSKKMVEMHSSVYNWKAETIINPLIDDIVDMHETKAALTGGKVTPRIFVRTFISVLDTVQQNPEELGTKEKILELFEKEEVLEIDDDF